MIWHKRTIHLDKDFPIAAKAGNNVFVANRGDLYFEYPSSWIVKPSDQSVCFYDAEPPADNCVLELSILHLSFEVDWTKCPLGQMLCAALDREQVPENSSEIHEVRRNDLRIVWIESSFTDPQEERLALSRSALALRAAVLPLFTLSFWPEDKPKCDPVWSGIFETLHLAEGQRFRNRN